MDLSQIKTEDLLAEKERLEKLVSKCSNTQEGLKVTLNSAYGALGNAYFRYFDIRQAEAVTLSGQLAIKWVQKDLNVYLNKLLNTDEVDYVIASDTDSVVGDTMIYVNGEYIKISDAYDRFCSDSNLIYKRDADDFVHDVSVQSLLTKSYTENEIVDDHILHIMKHKTKKCMYRVTVNDKEIIITEDHSLVVERNGNLISVKPNEVLDGDVFINISSDTGVCLKTVYNTDTAHETPKKEKKE